MFRHDVCVYWDFLDSPNFYVKIIRMKLIKFSKKQKVYIGMLLALVALLVWAFVSAGVITHNFNREQLKGTENRQELDISSIILTETKEKVKYWEIYGETGYYNSDNRVAVLNNVTGNFYKNNEVSMSFESSKGTYNEVKKQIILYNDTHIVLKDGTSLYADRLIWSGSDKDVIVQGHVRIVRNKEFLATAQRAIISSDYAKFKIIGKTSTKLFESKEKK